MKAASARFSGESASPCIAPTAVPISKTPVKKDLPHCISTPRSDETPAESASKGPKAQSRSMKTENETTKPQTYRTERTDFLTEEVSAIPKSALLSDM